MKYVYIAITMLSLTLFSYPDLLNEEKVQYYDMSEYEIIITPEK